jgi:hypothetical protein
MGQAWVWICLKHGQEVIAMTGISKILTLLEQAWQKLTFAGIVQIPFPRSNQISGTRR